MLQKRKAQLSRSLCALLLVAVLAGACNAPLPGRVPGAPSVDAAVTVAPTRAGEATGGAGSTPVPGATAAATDTAAPPTYTPVPPTDTPRPTATAQPAAILTVAAQAMIDGDFVAAGNQYQAALDGSSDPAVRAEAQYGLGVAALRDGRFADAAGALGQFLDQFPADPRVPDAVFQDGEALRSNQQWPEAIAAYERYLAIQTPDVSGTRPQMLAPYVYDRIGDSYIAQSDYVHAMQTYSQALAAGPFDLQLSVREKIAQAALSNKDVPGAVAQYDALIAAVQTPGLSAKYAYYLRAKYVYLAGAALLSAGDAEAAYARFKDAVANYPRAYDAYSSLVALLDAGVPVDDFQRGVVDYYAGAYDQALRVLALAESSDVPNNGDAHYYAGLAYGGLGNYDAAATEFNTVIDTHQESGHWSDAWLDLADAQASAGNVAGAIETYIGLSEKYPQQDNAAEGLWQALLLAERNDDWANAQRAGAALANYPAYDNAAEGVLRAGLAAYRRGDVDAAHALWQQIAGVFPASPLASAGLLWIAKTTPAGEAVAQLLSRAEAINPASIYALRAADLAAGGRAPFAAPAQVNLSYDETAERAAAEKWLAARLNIADDGALGTLPPALAQDARLERGATLWRLGLYPEANAELDSIRRAYSDDILASYQLALFLRDLGAYRASILAARAVLSDGGFLTGPSSSHYVLAEPRYFARLAYPTYYADLVLPEAQKYGLDPLLVFSLIQQESVFDGFARSSAAAQGLMQIIPPTGASIADALSWPNYINDDLYRPYVNVPFGIYYVAQQRNRFNGDVYAALAGYNAGPGNSARWFRQSNNDPDLYYETISLREPRLYIERIYERWMVYKDLYGLP